ncbi:cation diffusion facilitator family transporter [Avibacterium paragallinarum]|uniref:Cadmium, cobalt and zinc/H(+)-K(+) antiporter n=1 Tax=Avibacterium paragallinarum TaxID=728 RepID=A0A377I5N4_AVIPA|nr:cation diffusion facilitator family transporter [Avibacterium paragallinarum]POY45740.1 cation transporter [Avibacterium paragallinarum]RZN56833.1 cation transporter [Avibacterium paragallinarum]RZN74664.1 cation transporter [Avibacterium paragallinarum]TID29214.1 cytochrome C1 [Avibacterium paragallinarum]CDF97991.1 Putative Zinc transporter ZitB [Avibacterium paragallinarum JF4211]
MTHSHHHDHSHPHIHHSHNKRILLLSFVLITSYALVEWLGGRYFHSLALMADAGHMLNDSLSLFVALIALYLSPLKQKWLALINGGSLIVVALGILWGALERWQNPVPMLAGSMLVVAVLGLLVNLLVAWLMLKSDRENLNIRAAYLHVLADLFGSLVAIVAGLSAWLWNWQWVDLAASVILSILILRSGIRIVRQAIQDLHTVA